MFNLILKIEIHFYCNFRKYFKKKVWICVHKVLSFSKQRVESFYLVVVFVMVVDVLNDFNCGSMWTLININISYYCNSYSLRL